MPQFPPTRVLTLCVAALGGWATDAAFPHHGWWPLAIVGVAALVWATGRDSARWNALVAWIWGLSFFLVHLWWAHYAVGPIPWLALSVAEAGIVAGGLAAWTWARRARWLAGRTWWHAPVFALIWTVVEQLRQVWPFGGFPWGRLGFSQGDSPLLSLASIAGTPLVSFAVALTGYLLAEAVRAAVSRLRAKEAPGALRTIVQRVVAVAAVFGIGALVPLPSTQAEHGELRLGAVQGNVSEPGLGAFANAREVLHNHAHGTHQLAEQVGPGALDLVVWPENATDINPRQDADAAAEIDEAAEAIGAPILLGTDRYADDARYNEMILWEPGVGSVFAYAKQIPAAFAEYIPMRSIARLFSPAVDLVRTDMAPGDKIGVVPVPVPRLDRTVQVGAVICFEVAYDALIRDAVTGGAEVLLVPTNNASFGYTAESVQQLAMSRLRAVEHGRATVQISTVGVSAVIAPDGTVSHETGLFTHEYFAADVPLRTTLTIADRLDDWPIIVATVLAALALAAGVITGRRGSDTGPGRRPARRGSRSPSAGPQREAEQPETGSEQPVAAS